MSGMATTVYGKEKPFSLYILCLIRADAGYVNSCIRAFFKTLPLPLFRGTYDFMQVFNRST